MGLVCWGWMKKSVMACRYTVLPRQLSNKLSKAGKKFPKLHRGIRQHSPENAESAKKTTQTSRHPLMLSDILSIKRECIHGF